jgi:hypothetical protein
MMTQAFHVADAIALPDPSQTIVGRAAREDAYPIVVCRSFDATVARVIEWLVASEVAVISDDVVESLYGATLIRALRAAGKQPPCACCRRERAARASTRRWRPGTGWRTRTSLVATS